MRRLAPEEAALWKRVIAEVKPMHPVKTEAASKPLPFKGGVGMGRVHTGSGLGGNDTPYPNRSPKGEGLKANTLDGSWDRRLARGLVSPESSIDLHGYSLSSAYDRLDHGLEAAIARGDRVLLLVTGKAPGPESTRPHARGAIRAAVGDWLAASRHSGRIAAVRNAHPRHGGAGALYIVLRRPITAAPRNS